MSVGVLFQATISVFSATIVWSISKVMWINWDPFIFFSCLDKQYQILCWIKLSVSDYNSGFPTGSAPPQCMRHRRCGFDPWVRKIPLEEGMATSFSSLDWRIPMDIGAWRAIVHGVIESDTTDTTEHTHTHVALTHQDQGIKFTLSLSFLRRAETWKQIKGAFSWKGKEEYKHIGF